MLVLLGVLLVVAGFAVGMNPLLVVLASALATGVAAGLSPVEVLAAFGQAFNENRHVSAAWLNLPVIGVPGRSGRPGAGPWPACGALARPLRTPPGAGGLHVAGRRGDVLARGRR